MSAARFFIPSLPGQPADASVTMYGGHIPSAPPKNGVPDTESDAHLYFYLVRNKHIAETERTLLWSVPGVPALIFYFCCERWATLRTTDAYGLQ